MHSVELPLWILNASICASQPISLSAVTSALAAASNDCSWPGCIWTDTFDAGTFPHPMMWLILMTRLQMATFSYLTGFLLGAY